MFTLRYDAYERDRAGGMEKRNSKNYMQICPIWPLWLIKLPVNLLKSMNPRFFKIAKISVSYPYPIPYVYPYTYPMSILQIFHFFKYWPILWDTHPISCDCPMSARLSPRIQLLKLFSHQYSTVVLMSCTSVLSKFHSATHFGYRLLEIYLYCGNF